jgi:serine/threonine-protein kinase
MEALCDDFDAECQAGRIGKIEDYLARVDEAQRGTLLEELLALELWYRRKRKEQPSAAPYELRFPLYVDLIRKVCAEPTEVAAKPPDGATQVSQHPQQQTIPPNPQPRPAKKKDHAHLRPGVLLGDYEIQQELGRGGMGVVYLAKHKLMRRVVAVKVLSVAASSDPELVQRFLREVEMAAVLNHPHVVTAYDAQQIDGLTYLVLEYVPGVDLASYIKQNGPLSQRTAVHCILQAARGIAHAHRARIIHRDIKPHNLLYLPPSAHSPSELPSTQGAQYGTVKVLDVGLARANWDQPKASDLRLTNCGTMMGTVEFMSPEQAMDSRSADARSDIYSLGCTLHFLLTGRPPFVCTSLAKTVQAHAREAPPPLDLEPETDPDQRINTAKLNKIYLRMMEKKPEARFQTMREVVDAFKECLPYDPGNTAIPVIKVEKPPVPAEPAPPPPRPAERPRPSWTYFWLAIIAIAAILTAVTFLKQLNQ